MDEEPIAPAKSSLRFGHYEVAATADGHPVELGRGAMGITYKATDTTLQRTVALKVVNPDTFSGEAARQRFLREARAAAQLKHPNVASIFHLGTEGGTNFYAMEFIEGETLEALVTREGALRCGVALQITGQVASALSAAHGANLVHRDIKPANLMIVREADGQPLVKVIDFGLAKIGGAGRSDANLSRGGFLGTPHFASPEQVGEKEVDIRSDIYSLGATLWHMLTGHTLYRGSLARIMIGHLSEPPPYDQIEAPEAVLDLLGRMLAKNPAERFQTPAELLVEIRHVAQIVDPGALCSAWSPGTAVDHAVTVQNLQANRGLEASVAAGSDSACATAHDAGLTAATPRAIVAEPSPVSRVDLAAPAPAGNSSGAVVPTITISPTIEPASAPLPPPTRRGWPFVFAAALLVIAGGAAWLWMPRNSKLFSRFGSMPQSTPTLASTASPAPVSASPAKKAVRLPPSPMTNDDFRIRQVTPSPTPVLNPDQKLKMALGSVAEQESAGNFKEALYDAIKIAQEFPAYNGGLPLVNDILGQPKINLAMQRDWHAFADLLDEAANLGSGKAMLLGAEHARSTDPAKAFQLFQHAAEKGVPQAMTETGLMYLNGSGVARDPVQAEKWFAEASAHQDPSGAYALGECFLTGQSVPQDTTRAVKILQDAADHKSGDAKNLLGKLYLRGQAGLPASRLNAGDLFRQARDLDCPEAFYNMAFLDLTIPLHPKGSQARAAFLLQRGAGLANPFCMYYYARCLEGGIGVTAAPDQARDWYARAASLLQKLASEGSAPAQTCLAMCLEAGSGVTPNPRGAAVLYVKAATAGNTVAREWCIEHHVPFNSSAGSEPLGSIALPPNSVFKAVVPIR